MRRPICVCRPLAAKARNPDETVRKLHSLRSGINIQNILLDSKEHQETQELRKRWVWNFWVSKLTSPPFHKLEKISTSKLSPQLWTRAKLLTIQYVIKSLRPSGFKRLFHISKTGSIKSSNMGKLVTEKLRRKSIALRQAKISYPAICKQLNLQNPSTPRAGRQRRLFGADYRKQFVCADSSYAVTLGFGYT